MFKYPYGDMHELNLDWFLTEWKKFVASFTNKFTASTTKLLPTDDATVTVTYDPDSEEYNFDFGIPDVVRPIATLITYQASASGTVVPTGTWTGTIPTVPQGQYLWTRNKVQYNNGYEYTSYSVSRQGIDGNPVIHLSIPITAGTTITYSNSGITSDMRVINAFLSDLSAITSNISFATSNGSITLTGIFVNTATLDLDLVKTN